MKNNPTISASALIGFFLVNGVLSFFICLGYFNFNSSYLELGYGLFAMFTQMVFLFFLSSLFFGLMAKLRFPVKFIKWLTVSILTFAWVILFIDIQVYELFKNHINGLAINILTTPGGWESLSISNTELTLFAIGIVFVFFALSFAFNKWVYWSNRDFWFNRFLSKKRYISAFVFIPFLVGASIYAYGDLYDIPEIKRSHDVVPFHQPVTIKKAFSRTFGYLPTPPVRSMKLKAGGLLKYPAEKIEFSAEKTKTPNVLYIVIDCWRNGAMTKEITPNIYKYAEERGQVFTNHHAGGNATRNGMFSLLYGIYSSYWQKFLAENRTPVLFDRMMELDYKFGIYSSEPLTFPEFRKTAFAKLNDYIEDEFGLGEIWKRDLKVFDRAHQFLEKQSSDQPFYSMIFLDSAHSRYSFPKEAQKFNPSLVDYTYSLLTDEQKGLDLRNSYYNAVYFLDREIGKLLDDLDKWGRLDDTIVVITGDHGEEFMENGYTGHSGAFTREQTMSSLVILWPGKQPKTYDHFSTHFDVLPTLMQELGAVSDPEVYSMGHNLFDEVPHNYSLSCNWNQCAIFDNDGWIIFGAPGHNATQLEFRNLDYEVIRSSEGDSPKRTVYMSEVLRKMGRFSR